LIIGKVRTAQRLGSTILQMFQLHMYE